MIVTKSQFTQCHQEVKHSMFPGSPISLWFSDFKSKQLQGSVFAFTLSEDQRGPASKAPLVQAEELFGRVLRNDDSRLNGLRLNVKDSPSDTSLVSTAVIVTHLSILLNRDAFSATLLHVEQFSFSWCLIKIKANCLRHAPIFFSWEFTVQTDGMAVVWETRYWQILIYSSLKANGGQTGVGVVIVSVNKQKSRTIDTWQAAVDY